MKLVVNDSSSTVVELSNVKPEKFYGAVRSWDKRKVYIVETFDGWIVRGIEQMTLGQNFSSFEGESLSDTLQSLIESSHFEVYEFDSNKEFFTWLAE